MSHIIGRGRYARETYPKPAKAGGGSTGCQAAVVFSPDPPCTPTTTIRSDRSADQSPITGSPVGATNLGSDTTGATTGVSGDYATVSGGDQNVASSDHATIAGGQGNKATAPFASALSGLGALALAEFALAIGGEEAIATGLGSTAIGTEVVAIGQLATAFTGGNAFGDESFAAEVGVATGNSSVAIGSGQKAGAGSFSFTIAAGGTLVTIAGDVTSFFQNGDGVAVFPTTPTVSTAATTGITVASPPVFGGVDTTFNLSAPIDGVTTAGTIADTTIGAGSVAIGGTGNQAIGGSSSIVGGQDNLTAATAASARAGGKLASATRATQDAWASGSDAATPGNIQTSQIVLSGTTPGVGAGETVELTIDPSGANAPMQLDDNKAYTFRLSIVANGLIGGVRAVRSFEVEVTASQDAGAVTVEADTTVVNQGSAAAATWSVVVTAGAAPARLVVTFSTGATTAKAVVGAQIRFTEAFLLL
jgi:hypothetical protein